MNVTVTDPSDYFVYYSLSLTENDFNTLRQHQGLLVDFGNFSNMLGMINTFNINEKTSDILLQFSC